MILKEHQKKRFRLINLPLIDAGIISEDQCDVIAENVANFYNDLFKVYLSNHRTLKIEEEPCFKDLQDK